MFPKLHLLICNMQNKLVRLHGGPPGTPIQACFFPEFAYCCLLEGFADLHPTTWCNPMDCQARAIEIQWGLILELGQENAQLMDCSLVPALERDGEMRFRRLATLREFGQEELSSEERRESQRRHAGYLLALGWCKATSAPTSDMGIPSTRATESVRKARLPSRLSLL